MTNLSEEEEEEKNYFYIRIKQSQVFSPFNKLVVEKMF